MEELETIIASNIPAAIQHHLLNNLPPAPDRPMPSGIFYLKEYRCWIPVKAIVGLTPRVTWVIQDGGTGDKFRVRSLADDAGRGHHWLLRMGNYDG